MERPTDFEAADDTIRMAMDSRDGARAMGADLPDRLAALVERKSLLFAVCVCLFFKCLELEYDDADDFEVNSVSLASSLLVLSDALSKRLFLCL